MIECGRAGLHRCRSPLLRLLVSTAWTSERKPTTSWCSCGSMAFTGLSDPCSPRRGHSAIRLHRVRAGRPGGGRHRPVDASDPPEVCSEPRVAPWFAVSSASLVSSRWPRCPANERRRRPLRQSQELVWASRRQGGVGRRRRTGRRRIRRDSICQPAWSRPVDDGRPADIDWRWLIAGV
jgi:hypothetical protein